MNRMQRLQTVRVPSGGWLLSLVVVVPLAFVAGLGVDSLRWGTPVEAVASPALAVSGSQPGMGTSSAYDGSAPAASTLQWGGPYVSERFRALEQQAPTSAAISERMRAIQEWQAEHEAARQAEFAQPAPIIDERFRSFKEAQAAQRADR